MALSLELTNSDADGGCGIFRELLNSNAISSFADSSLWEKFDRQTLGRWDMELQQKLVDLFMEALENPAAASIDSKSKEKMVLFITRYGNRFEDEELTALQVSDGSLFNSPISVGQLVMSAAENRQVHLLKSLISKGVEPIILSKGLVPAALSGFGDIVDLLLNNCPVDDTSLIADIQMAWALAAKKGELEIIQKFLKRGIPVNTTVELSLPHGRDKLPVNNGTALFYAASFGHVRLVEFFATILDADFDFVEPTTGYNLLHSAAIAPFNRIEIFIIMLSKGVDPLALAKEGYTVLHILAGNQKLAELDLALFKLMVEKGCSLYAVDTYGNTPLHFLFENIELDFFDDEDYDKEYDYLHDILNFLIADGTIKSVVREDGLVPMQVAIGKRMPASIIRMLMPNTSSWSTTGDATGCPFHEAISPNGIIPRDPHHVMKTLDVLLEQKNVVLTFVDDKGRTPLLLAAEIALRWPRADIAKLIKKLLEPNGFSDVNKVNDRKWSAMHHLAWSGNLEAILELLPYGPDMESFDSRGYCPLHEAIEAGHVEIVSLLIERTCKPPRDPRDATWIEDADPDDREPRDSRGQLPIHVAANAGDVGYFIKLVPFLNSSLDITKVQILIRMILFKGYMIWDESRTSMSLPYKMQ